MRKRDVARRVVNAVNLSTAFGLAVAALGRARLSGGPHGIVLATEYRLGFPPAPAFTVGDVVLTRYTRDEMLARPTLMRHEERHTWQYVACLGLPLIPLYLLAAGWSWLRCRDFATRNAFERLAGLADGGYADDFRAAGKPGPRG